MNKFYEFWQNNKNKRLELAEKVGCTTTCLYRYAKGLRRPDDEKKKLIEEVTKGEVPVLSWFN